MDTYDAVGNRTARNQDGTLTTWTYDATYQLLTQQKSGAYSTFTYDSVGNISSKSEQGSNPMTFVYNSRNQLTTLLQGTALTIYTYSTRGENTVEQTGTAYTSYTYGQTSRMTAILYSDGTRSTYTYRGDGKRRTAQEPGGSVSTFILVLMRETTISIDILGIISRKTKNCPGKGFSLPPFDTKQGTRAQSECTAIINFHYLSRIGFTLLPECKK